MRQTDRQRKRERERERERDRERERGVGGVQGQSGRQSITVCKTCVPSEVMTRGRANGFKARGQEVKP